MNYAKTNWQEGLTPLSPANMNNIEQGIGQALWYGETSNSGNAFSVVLLPEPSSLYPGMRISIKVNADSSGPVTLDVNNLGARPVKKPNGEDVTEWKTGGVYTVVYDGLSFQLQGEGGEISSADLKVLKKRLANLTAFADIHNRVTGAQDVMYDIFETDDTNNSAGKLDITKTTLKQTVAAGTTVLTDKINAITGQFLTGQEITIADDVNMERRLVTRGEVETINTVYDRTAPTGVNPSQAYRTYSQARPQVLSNGWLVVVMFEPGQGYRIGVSKDNGATWSRLCYMSSSAYQPGGSICSDGTMLYILLPTYNSGYNFYFFRIDASIVTDSDIGSTANLDTATGNEVDFTSIAIDPTTKALTAVWAVRDTSYSNSYNIKSRKSVDGGTNWTKQGGTAGTDQIENVNTAGTHYKRPSLVYSQNGRPVMTYLRVASGDYRIICTYWTGSAWARLEVFTSSYVQDAPSMHVQLHGANVGRIWVFWEGKDATDSTPLNVRAKYSDDNGATWVNGNGATEKLTSGNSHNQWLATASTNEDGELHVYFNGIDPAISTTYANIRRIVRSSSGVWGAVQTITNNTGNHQYYPSLSEYPKFTHPLLVWQDNQAPAVKFRANYTQTNYITHLEVETLQNNYKKEAIVARSTVEVDKVANVMKFGKYTPRVDAYYYNLGAEMPSFVNGFSSGNNYSYATAMKNADNLYAGAQGTANTSVVIIRTWYTQTKVDLTNVATLVIDWAGSGYTAGNTGEVYFAITQDTTTDPFSSATKIGYSANFARRENTLDVSAITGSYHLCFFCRVGQYGRADGYMYRLYGKDAQGNILKIDGTPTPLPVCDARYNVTPKEGSAKEFNTWVKYEKDAGMTVDNSISVVAPAGNESYATMQKKVTSLDYTYDEAEFTAVTAANSKITQRITLTRSNTGIDKKVKQILGSVA